MADHNVADLRSMESLDHPCHIQIQSGLQKSSCLLKHAFELADNPVTML